MAAQLIEGVCAVHLCLWGNVIFSFSDTEWKSELVNSRNFDKEIGHQNPRYFKGCKMILLCYVLSEITVCALHL